MREDDLRAMGLRFKSLRLAKGWSQETCARKLGFSSKASVCRIETGVQGIRRANVDHVAAVLGTTPAYLMGWSETPPPSELNKQALIDKVLTLSDDQCKRISDLLDALIANKQ